MKKRKNNFMKYSYSKNINTTFEQAEIFVRDALMEIGFGILTEISIHDAFKEKLNIDYKKYKIQPSKFVIENELLYPEGCAIKYIIRHRDKGKKQDLEKAIHFIEMIIERDYK